MATTYIFKRFDQDIDGDSVAELRGSLYSCENFQVKNTVVHFLIPPRPNQ